MVTVEVNGDGTKWLALMHIALSAWIYAPEDVLSSLVEAAMTPSLSILSLSLLANQPQVYLLAFQCGNNAILYY